MTAKIGSARVLRATALALVLVLVPPPAGATDWYWVNDAGGVWDEEGHPPGGTYWSHWRDADDAFGMPGESDWALLVLPYTFSFCGEDFCYAQPVPVQYRSITNPTLGRLVITSNNLLSQTPQPFILESELHLTSRTEVVGGADTGFTPPPSYPLPDPPGIFALGRHAQWAGSNRVLVELTVGAAQGPGVTGIDDIEGTYELHGGTLHVGELGFGLEKVGAEGDGRFVQSGGTHMVESTLIVAEGPSSQSRYELTGGTLESAVEIIGSHGTGVFHQSGGSNNTDRLILGQYSGSFASGMYNLTGGELAVSGTSTIGYRGSGWFLHSDGSHRARTLAVGAGDSGTYELSGGELSVATTTTVGPTEVIGVAGDFIHAGGVHRAHDLVIGDLDLPVTTGEYRLGGGPDDPSLEVAQTTTVGRSGQGVFQHESGSHSANALILADGPDSSGSYSLTAGLLSLGEALTVGRSGSGELVQNGGRVQVHPGATGSAGLMTVGATGSGTYELLGGDLEVSGDLRVGDAGQGTFFQGAGTVAVSSHLVLGKDADGSGTYIQSGGTVTTLAETLGARGAGRLELGGGSHTVVGGLVVGGTADPGGAFTPGAGGVVSMTGGVLAADGEVLVAALFEQDGGTHESGSLLLNGGTYIQRGGTHDTGPLQIGAGGVYELHGGTLAASVERNEGRFEQVGGSHEALSLTNAETGTYVLHPGQRLELLEMENDGYFELRGAYGAQAVLDVWGGSIEIGHDGIVAVHNAAQIIGAVTIDDGRLEFHETAESFVMGDVNIEPQGFMDLPSAGAGAGQMVYVYGDVRLSHEYHGDRWDPGSIDIVQSDLYVYGDVFDQGDISLSDGVLQVSGTLHVGLNGVVRASGGVVHCTDVRLEGGLWLDPSTAELGRLTVAETGTIHGVLGDEVLIKGHFINGSRQGEAWDTSEAALILTGAGLRTLALAGEDRGDFLSGLEDNFAWGRLTIEEGVQVLFTDGNPDNAGTALYVGVLDIQDRSAIDVEDLLIASFLGDASLYYDPTRQENAYLAGLSYAFAQGAGGLKPAFVPLPASAWLFLSALAGVGGIRGGHRRGAGRAKGSDPLQSARFALAG